MESSLSGETADRSRVVRSLVLYPLAHLSVEIYGSLMNILWPILAYQFGLSYTAVGTLSMISRVTTTVPQLGFASLSDRNGPKWLAVVGVGWMAFGISTVGLAPSVMALALVLFFGPLGSAAFHPAGTSQVSRVLPLRRGLAVGLFMIGGTLGSAIGPKLGAWLVETWGVGATPRLMPIGLAVAGLMVVLVPGNNRRQLSSTSLRSTSWRTGLPSAVFVVMAIQVSQGWLELGVQSYLPLLMTGRGESLSLAATALTLFSLLGAAGAFLGGSLSDRFPRWKVLALVVLCSSPIYLATILLSGSTALLAAAVLGLVTAMSHPVTVAMAQELMPNRLAFASSLAMGISWVISSFGALVTGVLADHLGMQKSLVMLAVLPAVGITSVFMLRRAARPLMMPASAPEAVDTPPAG